MVAALTAVTGSRSDAEDAVQEALAKAWDRRGIQTPIAWVTSVALNRLRSVLRRRGVARRATPMPVPDLDPSAGIDARIDLLEAVLALPRSQREAVVLHYYLDLDLRTIARMERTTEATVKVTLYRGRRALARALGEVDEEVAPNAQG